MTSALDQDFKRNYEAHLKHLRLKGLQPKTIEAYARAIRRIGGYFDHRIDDLSEPQLTDYFTDLLASHSWSAVKLDLYGLKFYTTHVLKKPWAMPSLIKPPKTRRLPDILTVEEAERLFQTTRVLSYRVFYFTLYSLGLRLGEGLRRARNFGFLHPNSKRLIQLLPLLFRINPGRAAAAIRPRPALACLDCGGAMRIVRTRIMPTPPGSDRPTDVTPGAVPM